MNSLLKSFVFLTAVFFFSNLPLFMPYWGLPVVPWHTYLLVLGCTLFLATFRLPHLLRTLPRYLVVWLWLYLIHGILMFLYSSQNPQGLEMLEMRLLNVALLGTFLMILNLKAGTAILVQKAILCTVLFSTLVNLADFIDPMFSGVEGRAAGFYINPNIAGRMLSLGMVASLPLVAGRLRLLFCLLVGVGVFITFSRSGWLNWAVGIIALTASGYLIFRYKWPSILFFSLLGLAIVYSLISGIALELLSALNLSGYLTPDTLARISGFESSFADHSTSERARLAQYSWEVIQQHPLLGVGTDLRQWFIEALPHNMFLMAQVEAGVPGLLLFLALLWLLWRNTDALGRALLTVYIFSSLFTHNNLDEPATLLILALIASRRPQPGRIPHPARYRAQQRHGAPPQWQPNPALWSQQR